MRAPPTHPRLPDWPDRFADALAAALEQPFAWGTHDCCMMASNIALAITGRDPAAPWRGTYDTEQGAEAVIVAGGGLDEVVAGAMHAFGSPECPPAFARRGDFAIVTVDNMLTLGVVVDDRVAAPGLRGARYVPLSTALRAWAI